jgi:hypothetical protein
MVFPAGFWLPGGKKLSEVIPGLRESNPELFAIYGRVVRTGVPETFELYAQPLQMWFAISVYRSALSSPDQTTRSGGKSLPRTGSLRVLSQSSSSPA